MPIIALSLFGRKTFPRYQMTGRIFEMKEIWLNIVNEFQKYILHILSATLHPCYIIGSNCMHIFLNIEIRHMFLINYISNNNPLQANLEKNSKTSNFVLNSLCLIFDFVILYLILIHTQNNKTVFSFKKFWPAHFFPTEHYPWGSVCTVKFRMMRIWGYL